MLAPCEVLSMKKKTKTSPWSLAGGHEPEPSFMRLWPGTPAERRVGMHRASMAPGDRFVNVTAGGGGWGDPLTRAAELVLADVRDGYVSAAAARDSYGIDVAADGSWTPTPARIAAGEGQGE